jgi:Na+-transporting methylmalonyl-CoA/oxaloacetate decarboxylase gamma subunit
MDAVIYQVTGMCVVIICLSFLSVMLTISGAVAQRLDAKRKAQAEAAKAAVAPAPVAAPVVAPELPPAQVAAIAAGIYDAAQSSITPQVVAAIAAAVKVTVGNEARILDIKPVDTTYGQGGRAAAMNNSPVR